MKKIFNKVIIILLSLCLCSCTAFLRGVAEGFLKDDESVKTEILDDIDEISLDDIKLLLKDFEVKEKNPNNIETNEEFEEFLHSVVVDVYKDSYLSVRFDFVDYESFGIEKPEVSWGEIEEDNDKKIAEEIDQLSRLLEFDFDSLSYKQQYDYEVLEYSIYEDLLSLFVDFDEVLLFNSRTDLLSNVMDNLNDFNFYDQEALDDYMILLADTDRYLNDAIDYTNKVAKEENYYMIDHSIDVAEDYIDGFVEAEPNALISSFNSRIDELDFISEKDKKKYKEENEKIVNEEIIPVVLEVRDTVESQRGMTTIDNNRLINLDEDFAEATFIFDSSSNSSIDDTFEICCYVLRNMIAELVSISNEGVIYTDTERINKGEVDPLNASYDQMLEFLQENYKKTHPDIGVIEYDLSAIDASSASDSVVAYYWPAPIDKPEQNVIKYNPNYVDSDAPWEAYYTISHEGIPGHMYDVYRSLLNEENTIRRVISFIGFTEGYAMYSEICASKYLDIDEKTQKYFVYNEVYGYILDAVLDMAINYYNYSDDELLDLLDSFGINIGDIDYFKEFLTDNYGTLTRYGAGLAKILYIKEGVKKALGDKFNEIEFNDLFTRHGALPFVILEDEVNKYVNDKLNS